MTPRRALIGWLIGQTKPLLWPLGIATIARIIGDLLNVAILVLAVAGLVQAMTGEPLSLWPLALTLIILSLVKAGLCYLEQYAGHWVAFAALQRLRELLFRRLIPQAPAATTGKASAELTARATEDIDRIEVFFAHTIPPVIAAVTVPAIALAAFAVLVDPATALAVAIPLAIALLLPFVGGGAAGAASRAELAARADVAVHVADDVQGIREVLAFEARDIRDGDRHERESLVTRARMRIARARAVREIIERMLWGAAVVFVLLVAGDATTAVLAIAVLVGLWLGGAGTDDFASGLDAALAACARVRRVVDAPPAVSDDGSGELAGTGPVRVAFDAVSFAYPGTGSPALEDIDVTVGAGGWHRLVGVSGSGKSTVAGLLLRAHDVDAGRILLDGVPVSAPSLAGLRRAVAVVDQRPVLFPGTVADNLRLGRPDASDAELLDALETVLLGEGRLPDGLRTRVGERGSTLSGGQMQRIALARALVARPRLLVLDESLSQLDEATAQTVCERLGGMVERPTIIEITHRVDLLDDAATVTVIDRGRIVETGTAGELRAAGGAFAQLTARS
ncbi:ABC transporter ATP-binding protein [uncultured Microbacterium sp.]|uniref:ABC transporter ATP-binding protein n=1 Tax=uncultured Microbacterium sp. TaxID=191216 RepID=UPI0026128136|nr:ABC transporter ATP-binding protein [uncultured Microbacterium sp.]